MPIDKGEILLIIESGFRKEDLLCCQSFSGLCTKQKGWLAFMGKATREERWLRAIGILCTNAKASTVSDEALERIIQKPRMAGVNFTAFLEDSAQISKVTRLWWEWDSVIYFSLSITSDGTTGLSWIRRLENRGIDVSDPAKEILQSPAFKPTRGVTTNIAVLRASTCLGQDLYAEGSQRNLSKLNAEMACYLREKLSDKEIQAMGLQRISIVHDRIQIPHDLCLAVLSLRQRGGNHCLGADSSDHLNSQSRYSGYGFAFAGSLDTCKEVPTAK